MDYEKLSKNALGCMYVATWIGNGICLAILVVILKLLIMPNNITIAKYVIYFLMAMLIFNMLLGPIFRFHRYRYRIAPECIEVKEGYINVTRAIVPMERLHKIETQRGPIDRMFGVTKVNVTTAGGDVTIRFLKEERAQEIADILTKHINEIAGAQKEAVD